MDVRETIFASPVYACFANALHACTLTSSEMQICKSYLYD